MKAAPRPVRKLSTELIHRIAAGEVVEGPASVLKELLDNAIDAGATRLRITIVGGGERSLVIEDDGWGMSREDLEASIQRHATSKITDLGDLDRIQTLGFRGEALAAIASVSRLRIETARADSGAWLLEVIGGDRRPLRPSPRLRGTSVSVEDLFFNVPARRKFLKKASSLVAECREVLENVAAAHPGVAFDAYFLDDKGEVRSKLSLFPSSSKLRFEELSTAKGEVFGRVAIDPQPGVRRIEVWGLRPPATSRTQKGIRLLVNGRPILDRRLPFVAREAFSGLIEVGHFPVLQVHLEVDPERIDVNVHPQKKEVRWPADFHLSGLVYGLVKAELEAGRPAPRPLSAPSADTQVDWALSGPAMDALAPAAPVGAPSLAASSLSPSKAETAGESSVPFRSTPSSVPFASPLVPFSAAKSRENAGVPRIFEESSSRPAFRFAELRTVGEVGAAWIVCESPRGMVLIDQHAAHERVNFERILRRPDLIRSKPLLVPVEMALPWSLEDRRADLLAALEGLGFEFSDLSKTEGHTLELIALPEADRGLKWKELLESTLEELEAGEFSPSRLDRIRATIAASLACHGSVRRGQRLTNDEIRELLRQMDEVEWGGLCPHGRPLWVEWPHERFEGLFHR